MPSRAGGQWDPADRDPAYVCSRDHKDYTSHDCFVSMPMRTCRFLTICTSHLNFVFALSPDPRD